MKFLQKFFKRATAVKVEPYGVIINPWELIIDSSYSETNTPSMMLKMLKSRTIWTLVVLFIINGISGIRDQLNPAALTTIDAVLAVLAAYFRVSPQQNFHE